MWALCCFAALMPMQVGVTLPRLGRAAVFPSDIVLAVCLSALAIAVARRRMVVRPSAFHLALAAYAVSVLVSVATSVSRGRSMVRAATALTCVAAAAATAALVRTDRDRRRLVYAWLIGYEWDAACGEATVHRDPNNQATQHTFDALCRPSRVDHPLGYYERYSYRDFGGTVQRVVVSSPSPARLDDHDLSEMETMTYFDGWGREYRRRVREGDAGPREILVDTAFNARGSVASVTAPRYGTDPAYSTSFSYDSADRRIAVTFADAAQRTTTYAAWQRTDRDEHGHAVTATLDAYGRQTRKDEAGGGGVATEYRYDAMGRMTTLIDHGGNTWRWVYDSLGRLSSKVDPNAGSWTYEYDDSGRPLGQVDARGVRTDYSHDPAGRVATKRTSGSGLNVETVAFRYSEPRQGFTNVGRLTSVLGPDREGHTGPWVAVDYDAAGRAVKTVRGIEGALFTLQRRYDAAGRIRGITYPDGEVVGTPANPWTYDGMGRLRSIPGVVSSSTYDAAGRPVSQVNANSTTMTRSYSAARGFLMSIVTSAGGAAIQNLQYDPDPSGLNRGVTSSEPTESWAYRYDDLHRLEEASSGAASQSFSYDSLGRITYNSRVGTYGYPPPGSGRPYAPLNAGADAFGYDANGNVLNGAGRVITWNGENLPRMINGVEFLYDGFGHRSGRHQDWDRRSIRLATTTRLPVM